MPGQYPRRADQQAYLVGLIRLLRVEVNDGKPGCSNYKGSPDWADRCDNLEYTGFDEYWDTHQRGLGKRRCPRGGAGAAVRAVHPVAVFLVADPDGSDPVRQPVDPRCAEPD